MSQDGLGIVDLNRTLLQGSVAGFLDNPMNQMYMIWLAPLVKMRGSSILKQNIFKAISHFSIMAPITMTVFLGATGYVRSGYSVDGAK